MKYLFSVVLIVLAATCCISFAQNDSITIDWAKVKPNNVNVPGVGKKTGISPRIVGGRVATRGQFPYQAALFMDGRSFCGGSLVTASLVLSAAHCTAGFRSVSVYLGTHFLKEQFENTRVIYTSNDHTEHPSYTRENRYADYDISVVRLPVEVTFTSYIKPIRLPQIPENNEPFLNYVGDRARVSGWGLIADGTTAISSVLNFVDVSVIANSVCTRTFGGAINPNKLCVATTGGLGPCNGDSGGPLVIQESDHEFTQIGIVSFGSGRGCSVGAPAVFTRVTSYLKTFLAPHLKK